MMVGCSTHSGNPNTFTLADVTDITIPYLGGEPRVLVAGLEELPPVRVELGVQEEAVFPQKRLELHLLLLQPGKLRRDRRVRPFLLRRSAGGARGEKYGGSATQKNPLETMRACMVQGQGRLRNASSLVHVMVGPQ